MIPIRTLTEKGKESFRNYIDGLENPSELSPPDMNGDDYSEKAELPKTVKIDEKKTFDTRMELAKYITSTFKKAGISRADVISESKKWSGIWSWLAYTWFDQFYTEKNDGSKKIFASDRYVCSDDWNRYYRHFVAGPYYIYSLHGEDYSKLFLDCPTHRHKDIMEAVASRQFVVSNKSLVKVFHKLYWDDKSESPKKGHVNRKKPGNARRLALSIVNQFDLTYDLRGMGPDEIINLLPDEFKEWI